MRPEDIRAFVHRDWSALSAAKAEYWTERAAVEGPAPSLRASDALRRHVARYAKEELASARVEDLLHHVELNRRIDAANTCFRR